jgi:HPt (histidine-containing phosphotransfer) domain-containing protein
MSAALDDERLSFAADPDSTLYGLQDACWRGDLDQLGRLAHRLQQAARDAGAAACGSLCRCLEAACQMDDMQRAAQLVRELGPALRQLDIRLT